MGEAAVSGILKLIWTGFKDGLNEGLPRWAIYTAIGVGAAAGLIVAAFNLG